MRTNFSAYQIRILWAIWRKTYGYHKKQDWLSNSQLVEMTGIRKQHASRAVRELIQRNIVTRSGYNVSFNKDYTQWRELPKLVTKVTSTGDNCNRYRGTQKKKERNIASSKDTSHYSQKKDTDPRIKQIIDYFVQAVQETKEFKPMIASKDAAQVKRSLKNLSPEMLQNQIDFFLSNGKSKEHISLSAALSADTYNLYMSAWQRKKWQYGECEELPADKRWWQ